MSDGAGGPQDRRRRRRAGASVDRFSGMGARLAGVFALVFVAVLGLTGWLPTWTALVAAGLGVAWFAAARAVARDGG